MAIYGVAEKQRASVCRHKCTFKLLGSKRLQSMAQYFVLSNLIIRPETCTLVSHVSSTKQHNDTFSYRRGELLRVLENRRTLEAFFRREHFVSRDRRRCLFHHRSAGALFHKHVQSWHKVTGVSRGHKYLHRNSSTLFNQNFHPIELMICNTKSIKCARTMCVRM